MLALIMAGGMGKRLRPLTDKVPKPMVAVGGKPIIYWQIRWLESFGVDRFVLLGGYRAQKLVSYIKSMGYADKFDFSIEKEPLGTAGAIRNAAKFIKGEKNFLISNGDNVTNQNIGKLRLRGKYMCCISIVPYRSSKGIVAFSGERVTKFDEKPVIKGYWYNAGAMLLDAGIIKLLPKKGSLEHDVLPRLAAKGLVSCVKFGNSYLNSVDSIKDRDQIDSDLKSGKVRFRFS